MPRRTASDASEYLKSVAESVRPVAVALRRLVLKAAPSLTERMRYGMPQYVRDKHTVVYIMPAADHVNLGFYDGVDLDDPKKLLDGTGKRLRHVKVRNVQEVRSLALSTLIEEAVRVREKIGRPPKGW